MAAVMTYDSLVQDIIAYSERDDANFVAQLPRIIQLAEQSIAAAMKTLWETTVVTTRIVQGQASIDKPTRWRKTLSLKISPIQDLTPNQPVLLRDQTFVSQYAGEADNAQPLYYSDWDYNNWLIAPIPDQAYDLEIAYQGLVQPLDEQNQVNLITRECPQLLLYGCMVQACMYVKSFEKLQIWKPLYDGELASLTSEDNERLIDKNSKREQK